MQGHVLGSISAAASATHSHDARDLEDPEVGVASKPRSQHVRGSSIAAAAVAVALLGVLGCDRKPDVRQDPSATGSQSSSASPSALAEAPSGASPASSELGTTDAAPPKLKLTVTMNDAGIDVVGRLPPEVVKRIARANFPRLRACYEQGLKKDPTLKGTVISRFVIDAKGAVESASSKGGAMPDKSVADCVVNVFRTLSFPEPESGKVTVTYPVDFEASYEVDSHPKPLGLGSSFGKNPGEQGIGCPCGCDRSEDMVAELRPLAPGVAVAAIDDSLRTIGAREDAGYITDRMVRHRLRLLAFGEELGRVGPIRFTAIPPIRPSVSGTIGATSVGAQLVFHGETTELVHGKEKRLSAAFIVRFDLENRGSADVTLHAPTLESAVALPLSRWYLVGSDGQPWDGVLRVGQKARVHAIGYAGEPVPPGAEVAATIQFESLRLRMETRARAHWNQVD